ncbi:MAG: hypothetical protein RJQ00_11720 [Vicingaceae bacterium]
MKNLIGFLILIGLAVAAYFILNNNNTGGGNKEELRDFAIEDTAAVDQIYLSQPNGKEILLSRRNSDHWLVNGKFKAREDAIDLILTTLHDIKIKSPVSQQTFEGVVKRLAVGSTKAEFYTGGEKAEKTWYIGDASPGRTGTYMLLEEDGKKSSKPFVTHLIMERGYLGSRFFLDPTLWKSREMMEVNPQKIKSIKVAHGYDSATGFIIEQTASAQFKLMNLKTEEQFDMPSELAIPYFKNFEAVFYEYIDLKTPKEELDSIYNSFPRHKLEIKMQDDRTINMSTFNMPVAPGSMLAGKPIDYHPERMYAYSSELGPEVHPIVQNLTFNVLVPRFEDFISSTTVEK